MKIQSFFDPDSAESFALVLFLWRLKKAARPAIAGSVIALFAVLANTMGPMLPQKGSDDRVATRIDAKLKPASYRQIGPWGRIAGS
jgi:hypothetical protein